MRDECPLSVTDNYYFLSVSSQLKPLKFAASGNIDFIIYAFFSPVMPKPVSHIPKVVFVLLIAVIIRIIPGCCDCNEPLQYFNFNTTRLTFIDNAGTYPRPMPGDTMNAAAVAIKLEMADSAGYFQYSRVLKTGFPGFSTASAWCYCPIPMKANAWLKQIKITTLYPISDEIAAGTDVSSLFVGSLEYGYYSGGSLYLTLESLCLQTNDKTYQDAGIESFLLFLKPEVAYDSARFAISLSLSDNRILNDTTSLIHIRR